MSCKSCSSLVWVLRSVENSAGQILIFEPELRCPTIMTAKPLLLNHPNSLDTPPWMILDGGYEDP
jgi:hypothetical protein